MGTKLREGTPTKIIGAISDCPKLYGGFVRSAGKTICVNEDEYKLLCEDLGTSVGVSSINGIRVAIVEGEPRYLDKKAFGY